ncbi:MAG: hypothetical protein QOD41_154 [Cryptosporangiaceae bacterium]|nr:hypothetical protein [Cryptosporangiaceae bacterium]
MRIGAAAGADADFRRLWTGAAISQLGSAVGMVALPVVAVAVVRESAFQVSLLAAVSAVTTVLVSLPVGVYVEFRRKRPVLIGSDLVRCGSLLSIPCAAAFGSLTFAQLCVVAALNAVGQIAFVAASQANLAGLVTREDLVDANSRLQATNWLSLSAGPSIGGALIGFLGAAGTLAVDALSFLGSALAVVRIRAGEPAPPRRDTSGSRRREIALGLHFVVRDPVLRRMLLSWVIFAGAVGMAAPLSTVFYLRDLHFTPWQYGLIMGIPSLGGFAGARLVRRAAARSGAVRALWWASVLRGPWYFLIPLAMPGYPGLVTCVVGVHRSPVLRRDGERHDDGLPPASDARPPDGARGGALVLHHDRRAAGVHPVRWPARELARHPRQPGRRGDRHVGVGVPAAQPRTGGHGAGLTGGSAGHGCTAGLVMRGGLTRGTSQARRVVAVDAQAAEVERIRGLADED